MGFLKAYHTHLFLLGTVVCLVLAFSHAAFGAGSWRLVIAWWAACMGSVAYFFERKTRMVMQQQVEHMRQGQ